jgi:hypothetical protein
MPFPASATFAAASAALLACLSDVRLDEIRVDASLEHRKGSSRRGGKERQGDKRAGAKPKQQRTARSPRLGYRIGFGKLALGHFRPPFQCAVWGR